MNDVKFPFDHDGQTQNDSPNRAYDIPLGKTHGLTSLSIMNIDEVILNYIETIIKPTISINDSVTPVPVIYGTAERWAMFRTDGHIRESDTDKIQAPLILFRRKTIERDVLTNPVNKYIELSYQSSWNPRMAYDKFFVLNGITPSRQYRAVIIPDYVIVSYDVILWTELESQMSELIGQFQVESDEYWGVRNGYKFRVRLDTFDVQSDIEPTEDRVVRTAFQMKINAYLIPERIVKNFELASSNRKFFTPKKVVIKAEVDNTKTGTRFGPKIER